MQAEDPLYSFQGRRREHAVFWFITAMDHLHERLVACFQAVFPAVSDADIPALRQDALPAWGSLETVTLIRVIEEEFGVEIDLFSVDSLNSFEAFKSNLEDRPPQA